MAEINSASAQYNASLNDVLDAIVADLTEIRSEVVNLVADVAELHTHVDAGTATPAALTSADPAALTTTTD